jgi:hypothetical protein
VTGLVELIEQVHRALDEHELPHAFGGALALGYITEPRGTVDIDVNVFVDPERLDQVRAALAPLAYERASEGVPAAGVRFESEVHPFPINVFPSLDPRYAEIEARCVEHPFGRHGDRLPFLSAVDLSVFKLSFGRPKDWVDLVGIADTVPDLDLEVVEELLVALRGPTMYPSVARFRSLFATAGGR